LNYTAPGLNDPYAENVRVSSQHYCFNLIRDANVVIQSLIFWYYFMTTIFSALPLEIYHTNIFPHLTGLEIRNFSLVSRTVLEAVINYQQNDISLAGKNIITIPGSIPALLYLRQRMDIIPKLPKFFVDQLNAAREAVSKAGYDANDISRFIQCANDHHCAPLTASIVPFDFNTKKIQGEGTTCGSLGAAFTAAIGGVTDNSDSLALIRIILAHPNAANISVSSFGWALWNARLHGNTEVEKAILSHPIVAKIFPAEGDFGLGKQLTFAVWRTKPEIVEIILSLPNAVNIPAEGEGSLVESLSIGLGRILFNAIHNGNLKPARAFLSLPNAANLPAYWSALIADLRTAVQASCQR
jgi:hypothetical protein